MEWIFDLTDFICKFNTFMIEITADVYTFSIPAIVITQKWCLWSQRHIVNMNQSHAACGISHFDSKLMSFQCLFCVII